MCNVSLCDGFIRFRTDGLFFCLGCLGLLGEGTYIYHTCNDSLLMFFDIDLLSDHCF